MVCFRKSAPQHGRTDDLAGRVKLDMQVVRRLLNKDAFCQPFSYHTEDAARNARYLPFLLLVSVVRQLFFYQKKSAIRSWRLESYLFRLSGKNKLHLLWERLPAAIILFRGWKPLPQ